MTLNVASRVGQHAGFWCLEGKIVVNDFDWFSNIIIIVVIETPHKPYVVCIWWLIHNICKFVELHRLGL